MVREALLKFTRELPGTLNVRRVDSSGITIGDTTWDSTIVVTPDEVDDQWPDKPVESLLADDFAQLLDTQPEVVILGTGDTTRFAPRELMFAFARSGVGLETMDSTAAARTFNVLAGEGRKVVAVLYTS